ncbi:MAG: DUF368 domain-containing protein [Clostridia bacterium]|nr:DUF368 domain-containing protein [Clostridia bacterium]
MEKNKFLSFLSLVLKGIPVGIAFIIPGFSGGSVAAIIGIYDQLLEAITGLKKHFKQSIGFLIPILVGMILGIAALILPIKIFLPNYPIIVVSLFIGLSLGGLWSITPNVGKLRDMKWYHAFSFLLPLAFAAVIGFLPNRESVDLINLNAFGYVLLFLVGIVGSCALIVPGISGSMLLLILGYYNPILELVTDYLLHGQMIGHCLLVVLAVGLGIVVGFFLISFIMKKLLTKCPKGTYIAIVGFIIGSVPTAYIASCADAMESGWTFASVAADPVHWIIAALFLIVGIVGSLLLVKFSRKSTK